MSYIISKGGHLVAVITASLKSGSQVEYGYETCKEGVDANFDRRLINPRHGKISNAKHWASVAVRDNAPTAVDIYTGDAEHHKNQSFVVIE